MYRNILMLTAWYYKIKSNKLEEYKKNMRQITIVSKKVRKIDDQEDYERSGFKDIMDDVENTRKEALESVPQVPDEQVPTKDETSKELLYGSNDNDNRRDKKARIR
jgi:hypothetical protein